MRRKNFIAALPYQASVIMAYDIGDFNAPLAAMVKATDYAGLAARQGQRQARRQSARHRHLCCVETCGIASSKAVGSLGAGVGSWESAEVRVNPVATIETLTGSRSPGQGRETTLAQLIAERIGVPISRRRSSMAIPTRCSSARAPTVRARSRSAAPLSGVAISTVRRLEAL